MLELEVILDFACCICHNPMGVTLKCEGQGLAANLESIASVKAPCPSCWNVLQIYFKPNGTLHHVAPDQKTVAVPVPSCN